MKTSNKKSEGNKPLASLASTPLDIMEVIVADLLLMGFSYSKIGDQLQLSPKELKTHYLSLYSKLGVNSKKELLEISNGFVFGGKGDL